MLEQQFFKTEQNVQEYVTLLLYISTYEQYTNLRLQ